ncbi:unnamed protein product [Adineta steineri]|uniref:Uncharacterized protein n=1 Tax=Adineta steineri TaxID=433720 RepID=A0A814NNS4_9BILA|nr:unnamed protein product [Adineta steineri]
MKAILFSLVIIFFVIVVRCSTERSETNTKQGTASKRDAYDGCRKRKNGKYFCRCGKTKVKYDHLQQVCVNEQVIQRSMTTSPRRVITPIYRSTRDEQYGSMRLGLQRVGYLTTIPLRHVYVEAQIHSFTADVTLTQTYYNEDSYPVEAVYIFPIEENAAIYEFTAHIDNRLIKAVVQEKNTAENMYEDAIQRGQTAVLLRQDERTLDTFKVNVGVLPPGKECIVKIRYVTELDLIDGCFIRFVVPTTIAPRYDPKPNIAQSLDRSQTQYVQNSSYTMSFRAHIDRYGQNQIIEVTNMSHPVNYSGSFKTIDVSSESTALDHDIILDIELPSNRSPILIAAEQYNNASNLAVLTILNHNEERFLTLYDGKNPIASTTEFIFIIDCSDSMDDENRINLARDTMVSFIGSIPMGAHFNIIRFGSYYQILFSDTTRMTTVYNEQTAQQAKDLASTMRADLGGTELLKPLQYLKDHPPASGKSRQVFILTDGEIANTNEVIELCRSMALTTRIFSFGLGPTSSRSLVKGIARATNGHFVFIAPNDTVDHDVATQLRRALQPSLVNGQLQWLGLWPNGYQAPKTIPPVYKNDRVLVYTLFDKFYFYGQSASVKFSANNRLIGNSSLNRNDILNGNTIRRLAAKALIQELLHKGDTEYINSNITVKQRIIGLSLAHQILSPYTAFVGIETSRSGQSNALQSRHVPIQVSRDGEHLPHQHSSFPGSQQSTPLPSVHTHSSTIVNFPTRTTPTLLLKQPYFINDYDEQDEHREQEPMLASVAEPPPPYRPEVGQSYSIPEYQSEYYGQQGPQGMVGRAHASHDMQQQKQSTVHQTSTSSTTRFDSIVTHSQPDSRKSAAASADFIQQYEGDKEQLLLSIEITVHGCKEQLDAANLGVPCAKTIQPISYIVKYSFAMNRRTVSYTNDINEISHIYISSLMLNASCFRNQQILLCIYTTSIDYLDENIFQPFLATYSSKLLDIQDSNTS